MMRAFHNLRTNLRTTAARLGSFRRDDSGAALVEYAMLIGLMAVAVIAAAGVLTPKVIAAFTTVGTHLTTLN